MLNIESAYLIWAMANQQLTPGRFYTLFDEDINCLRFFNEADSQIITYLLSNGGITNVPAFHDFIGDSGQQRMNEISAEITNIPYRESDGVLWAATLQYQWQLRECKHVIVDSQTALDKINGGSEFDNLNAMINRMVGRLSDIASLRSANQITDSYQASEGARHILYAALGLESPRYLPTHFTYLDRYYAPITKGEVCILGGAEGSGKTALAQKWTYGMGAGLFFCEMPEAQMKARDALRIARVGSMVDLRRMGESGDMQYSDVKYKLDQTLESLADQPVLYKPSYGATALDVFGAANYTAQKYGKLDYIVIDHIQLLNSIAKTDQSFKVRQVYFELREKLFTAFPDTALLILQHLNGDIKRTYKGSGGIKMIMPQKSDLSYGGSGEADTAMILVRNPQYMLQLLGLDAKEKLDQLKIQDKQAYIDFMQAAFLWIVKTRSGAGEGNHIPMRFFGRHYDFEEKKMETLQDRIQAIKAKLDPLSVIAKYGNQTPRPGANLRCPNKNHAQTGKTPPCSMDYQTGLWHCHGGCGASGDLLDWIGFSLFTDWNPKHRGKRLLELLDMLAGLQITPVPQRPAIPQKTMIKRTFDNATLDQWTQNLLVYPELIAWLAKRGVKDIERWRLGYYNKRLMITWHYKGVCIAVKCRTNPFMSTEPKYTSLSGSTFATPYNADCTLDWQKKLYLVESELDAMLIMEYTGFPCIALPAGNIKKALPFITYSKEVVLIRDNDQAGFNMAAVLMSNCRRAKIIAPPDFVKDIGEYYQQCGGLWEI